MMQVTAFKCDECGDLVEKADNVLKVGKQGIFKKNEIFNDYQLEIRFFRTKYKAVERNPGKAVDLCENCKKFISGAGEIDQDYRDKKLPVSLRNSNRTVP
jgi:hypothetical protein